jgi:hypothetical protein
VSGSRTGSDGIHPLLSGGTEDAERELEDP